jgi:hypothetical protein
VFVRGVDYVNNTGPEWANVGPLVNDTLLVTTQGRGAWTFSIAGTTIASQPVLQISGTEQNDAFILSRNAGNPSILDVSVNGSIVYSTPLASLQKIQVFGKGGNDTLTLDSTNGAVALAGGIEYTSSTKTDEDTVVFTGGKELPLVTPSVTVANADGTSTVTYTVVIHRGGNPTNGGNEEKATSSSSATGSPTTSPTRPRRRSPPTGCGRRQSGPRSRRRSSRCSATRCRASSTETRSRRTSPSPIRTPARSTCSPRQTAAKRRRPTTAARRSRRGSRACSSSRTATRCST